MTDFEKRIAEKNGTLSDVYGDLVNAELRKIYSQSQVEAILNNYLSDSTNPEYVTEFKALQEYRKQCKIAAKKELEVNS